MNGKEILEKIKKDHIKPKPRWEFLLKNYIIWAGFIITILIGSLATGVMIFMVSHTDWQYHLTCTSPAKQILLELPYFWLVLLAIFIILALYNLKHTKKGYKYNPLIIVATSIIVSIIIGSVVYAVGGGERLENIFYQRIPFYQKIIEHRGRMLLRPEEGIIPGVVAEVDQGYIKVMDFRGQIWEIATSTQDFVVGQRVILVGKNTLEDEFEGKMIKPWFKPGSFKPRPCPSCLGPRNHLKENFR